MIYNKQFLILMYGPVGSGKTTLSKKIEKKFKINRVCNDHIRNYFVKNIQYYKSTSISYSSSTSNYMGQAVNLIRNIIIQNLISIGESVILDSGNIRKSTRKDILKLKNNSIKNTITIVIKCDIDEKDLIARLEKRDLKSQGKTKRKDFFLLKQKYKLEDLSNKEVDFILNFNQKNTRQIFSQLQNIIGLPNN